jgi:hypothetical protein
VLGVATDLQLASAVSDCDLVGFIGGNPNLGKFVKSNAISPAAPNRCRITAPISAPTGNRPKSVVHATLGRPGWASRA